MPVDNVEPVDGEQPRHEQQINNVIPIRNEVPIRDEQPRQLISAQGASQNNVQVTRSGRVSRSPTRLRD